MLKSRELSRTNPVKHWQLIIAEEDKAKLQTEPFPETSSSHSSLITLSSPLRLAKRIEILAKASG